MTLDLLGDLLGSDAAEELAVVAPGGHDEDLALQGLFLRLCLRFGSGDLVLLGILGVAVFVHRLGIGFLCQLARQEIVPAVAVGYIDKLSALAERFDVL